MRYNLDYSQPNLVVIAEHENGLSREGIPFDLSVSIYRLKLSRVLSSIVVRVTL